jgi:hypothetical protein
MLSNLERASDHEVERWLEEELKLTPYQKSKLKNEGIIRHSFIYFYKDKSSKKSSFLWRLTIIPYVFYYITLFCFLPINFLITSRWGYGRNFMDKFHSKWVDNIK